jgi:nucleotide-binding universal stress UspA family protein
VTYKTLMAHLDVGNPNPEVLRVAGELAVRLGSKIVGIAACQPMQMVYGEGFTSGAALVDCQDVLKSELRDAEAEFREALKDSKATLEWRSDYTTEALPYYIASEARCADLLITSVAPANALDPSRHTSIGDLLMQVGRPILIVPHTGAKVPFERIVIAWRDTKESRRAAVEALPLLALASHVMVLEVAESHSLPNAQGRVEDVAVWLGHHGVTAIPLAVSSSGSDSSQIDSILTEHDTDLVVAGAYGHNRLREWVFGGVTHNLMGGSRCALLSH